MKAYLKAFVNWEQNNWVNLLPMVEFMYNNVKNTSIGNTSFKLHCGFYPKIWFQKDVNPHSKSCLAKKLAKKRRVLIEVCYQNLFHAQERQWKAHNKGVTSGSYTSGEKIWLNSKYIKTK